MRHFGRTAVPQIKVSVLSLRMPNSELKEINKFPSTHYDAMFYVSIGEAWNSFLSTGFDVIGLQRYNFLRNIPSRLCRFCRQARQSIRIAELTVHCKLTS